MNYKVFSRLETKEREVHYFIMIVLIISSNYIVILHINPSVMYEGINKGFT
jgi:hypothetical protein